MGVLRDHPLQLFIDRGYHTLAETGTGTGTAIRHAQQFSGLHHIYSCDIDSAQIELLSREFEDDPRVRLFPFDSESYLRRLLGEPTPLIAADQPVIWFLDSHYPGFDLHKAAIDAEPDLDVRLPLHRELDLLRHYKRDHDVVICDDLRIYERGPFTARNMDEIGYGHAAAYDRPLPLVAWEATHKISRDYRDTGYLIMVPHEPSEVTP